LACRRLQLGFRNRNYGDVPTGYNAWYVIDRLCTGALPVTNMQAQCTYEGALGGGSNKIGSTPITGVSLVYYRVTVRVVGPHNAQLFTQSVVAK
jgi:hypothetical protein